MAQYSSSLAVFHRWAMRRYREALGLAGGRNLSPSGGLGDATRANSRTPPRVLIGFTPTHSIYRYADREDNSLPFGQIAAPLFSPSGLSTGAAWVSVASGTLAIPRRRSLKCVGEGRARQLGDRLHSGLDVYLFAH